MSAHFLPAIAIYIQRHRFHSCIVSDSEIKVSSLLLGKIYKVVVESNSGGKADLCRGIGESRFCSSPLPFFFLKYYFFTSHSWYPHPFHHPYRDHAENMFFSWLFLQRHDESSGWGYSASQATNSDWKGEEMAGMGVRSRKHWPLWRMVTGRALWHDTKIFRQVWRQNPSQALPWTSWSITGISISVHASGLRVLICEEGAIWDDFSGPLIMWLLPGLFSLRLGNNGGPVLENDLTALRHKQKCV